VHTLPSQDKYLPTRLPGAPEPTLAAPRGANDYGTRLSIVKLDGERHRF